jgi:hypothetical protein
MILLVNLQMLVKVVDPVREYGYLHLRRTRVCLSGLVFLDNFGLLLLVNHNKISFPVRSVFHTNPARTSSAYSRARVGVSPSAAEVIHLCPIIPRIERFRNRQILGLGKLSVKSETQGDDSAVLFRCEIEITGAVFSLLFQFYLKI